MFIVYIVIKLIFASQILVWFPQIDHLFEFS